jgi:uncharacterized protein YjbJ (UPF0337 family)
VRRPVNPIIFKPVCGCGAVALHIEAFRNRNGPDRLARRESSQGAHFAEACAPDVIWGWNRLNACAQQGATAMDKDRIAGSAKDFAGKVEGAVGDMSGNAPSQAAGRAREAAGTVQNLYGQAKDAARDASDAAVGYARDAYENSGDTFRDGSQAVAKKVQDNPLGALLVAAGIGFALAMLMTRPPRRPPPRGRYRYYG